MGSYRRNGRKRLPLGLRPYHPLSRHLAGMVEPGDALVGAVELLLQRLGSFAGCAQLGL